MLSITSNKRLFFLAKRVVFLTALAFVICFAAQNAAAANFTVTRSDDRNLTCVSGVDCSLREAVNAVNAAPTNDTINFSPSVTTIVLTDDIVINDQNETFGTLTITGNGANVLTIDGGAGTNRIFSFFDAMVTIIGVTLTGGNGTSTNAFFSSFNDSGGAIFTLSGKVVLDGVHVTANSTIYDGGVYFNGGIHQVLNSTFSANIASGDCGALMNQLPMVIYNSTFSGNTAGNEGGGLCFNSDAASILRNVTVTGNSAAAAGGIAIFFGAADLGNTIVSGNTAAADPDIGLLRSSSVITTAGYNLIGNNSSVQAVFPAGNPNAAKDIVGTSASPINPMLGTLQNNGGSTPTHALLFGSPAIDKGSSFGFPKDQRGSLRPVNLANYPNAIGGNGADIGAFETQLAPTAATVSVGGRITTGKGDGIVNVRVTLTKSNGEMQTAISGADGYFQFADVEVGETYIFNATAKRYQFSQPTQVQTILDANADIIFIGFSEKQRRL